MTPDVRQQRYPDRDRNAEGRAENQRPRDRFGAPLPRDAPDELGERVDPADVSGTIEEGVEQAAALFDGQRFFEAHEFFEYVWKHPEVPPCDRDFWKGVTQVAVGCTHCQRGNTTGALRLLNRALAYLNGYPSPYRGVDTDALRRAAQDVITQVRDRGASPDLRFVPFPRA